MLILESIFIGFYSCCIYFIVRINSFPLTLFIVGFLKHLFGYFIGLHSYYCKRGSACKKYNKQDAATAPLAILIGESILEGAFYVCIGLLLTLFLSNSYITVFLIGVILHESSEILNIHDTFCKTKCN
jgi:hypothetical protein